MRTVFLDTGYLVAVEVSNDQHHAAAIKHWNDLRNAGPLSLVTTSLVFAEVMALLNRRGHHARAVQLGNRLLQSPTVRLIHITPALFDDGWSYFQLHDDKQYSLVDCVSFVVMQQWKIETAFTFDHHFWQAGFAVEP